MTDSGPMETCQNLGFKYKLLYLTKNKNYLLFGFIRIMATIASMSSRGQIVLPISIRRKLNLGEGSQFLVISDDENILLKPVREPSLDEFYSLIEKAQETARKIGLTEEEINSTIKEMRAEKRK